MSDWSIVGAFFAALAILAVAYGVTMLVYFVARRRHPHRKWLTEVLVVGGAALACCVLNVIMYYLAYRDTLTFADAVAYTFRGFFNGVGHMAFDSLDTETVDLFGRALFACVYYGSVLYMATLFVSVLTATVNYELYSRLVTWVMPKRRRDVYVFTDLNTETLCLAADLARQAERSLVVFAIPELKPFDRHDELCREVMAHGFYYWSYSAAGQNKSIARVLRLNNRNAHATAEHRFCVFAFASKDYIPQEEQNMAVAFEDIAVRMAKGYDDGLRVNYYVLTKRQIKHAAYDDKLRDLRVAYYRRLKAIYADPRARKGLAAYLQADSTYAAKRKALDEAAPMDAFFGVDESRLARYIDSDKLAQAAVLGDCTADEKARYKACAVVLNSLFAGRFAVQVWDEASVIAKDILDRSTDLLVDTIARGQTDLRVMTLGFGETGSAATMALYEHAAFVRFDKTGTAWRKLANTFAADVYDVAGAGIARTFAEERPYSCIAVAGEEAPLRTAADVYTAMTNQYAKHHDDAQAFRRAAEDEMALPHLVFYAEDCRRLSFVERFGDDDTRPDCVVVATGDDYANVRMANAIIQRVVNNALDKAGERVDVFVNVWDKENNALLASGGGSWDEAHRNLTIQWDGKTLLVVHVVGNNEDIYSAAHTVQVGQEAIYNHQYNLIAQAQQVGGEIYDEAFYRDFSHALYRPDRPNGLDCDKACRWVAHYVDQTAKALHQAQLGWILDYYALDPWLKESNNMVRHNAALYRALLDAWKVDELPAKERVERYAQLCYIEHQRWNRLHLSYGWIYNGEDGKREGVSQHNCLVPYAYAPADSILYDLSNIVMARLLATKE